MSIDVDAMLIYEVPYEDLPEEILEEVDEMLDNGDLDYASPWYDAPRDEWIVGVEIPCWGASISELYTDADNLKWDVPKVIRNLDLGLYVTPHVS